MKLTFSYNVLTERLSLLTNTLKNALATQNDKFLVFRASASQLEIFAFSATVVVKTVLKEGEFGVSDLGADEVVFQLPVQQFSNFLANYAPSEISRPLEVYIEPVTNYMVTVGVVEEIGLEGSDVVVKDSDLRLTTSTVNATIFGRLEVIRSASDESIEFSVLDEDSERPYLEAMVTDLLPYMTAKTAQLVFQGDGFVKSFDQNMFVRYVNSIPHFFTSGGINPMGISVIRDLVQGGKDFSFYNDEEVGSLVFKLDNTVLGILYDKKPASPKDLIAMMGEVNSITLSRPIFDMHVSRMKSMATNLSTTVLSFTIDDEVSSLSFSGADLHADIDIIDFSVVDENKALGGRSFDIPLASLDRVMFGKQAYADDFQIAFWSVEGREFALFSDSSKAWNILITV